MGIGQVLTCTSLVGYYPSLSLFAIYFLYLIIFCQGDFFLNTKSNPRILGYMNYIWWIRVHAKSVKWNQEVGLQIFLRSLVGISRILSELPPVDEKVQITDWHVEMLTVLSRIKLIQKWPF